MNCMKCFVYKRGNFSEVEFVELEKVENPVLRNAKYLYNYVNC